MKQVVIQFAIKVRQMIGMRPVSFTGVSYNGSIRGLGPRGEGSTPSTPTNMSLWRNRHTQAVQSRFIPGSNPGRDTTTPGVGTGIRSALKMRWLRVRIPLGRPNVIYVRVTELAQVLR